jgi:hypothetical protein
LRVFDTRAGTDTTFGAHVWNTFALGVGTGVASRFLVVEEAQAPSLATGYVYELYTRSLAPGEAPAMVANGVESAAIDHARKNAVYSIAGTGDLGGVWVAPLQ